MIFVQYNLPIATEADNPRSTSQISELRIWHWRQFTNEMQKYIAYVAIPTDTHLIRHKLTGKKKC